MTEIRRVASLRVQQSSKNTHLPLETQSLLLNGLLYLPFLGVFCRLLCRGGAMHGKTLPRCPKTHLAVVPPPPSRPQPQPPPPKSEPSLKREKHLSCFQTLLHKKIHQHRPQIAVLAQQHLQTPKNAPSKTRPSIEQKCVRTITLKSTPNSTPQDTQPSILRKSTSTPNRIPTHHLSCMPPCNANMRLHRHLHARQHPSVNIAKIRPHRHQHLKSPQTASHSTIRTSTPNCIPPCVLPAKCKNARATSPPKTAPAQAPQTACPLAPHRQS